MGVGWVVEDTGCQSFGGESYLVEGVLGQEGYIIIKNNNNNMIIYENNNTIIYREAMPRCSRPPESETAPSLPSRR